MPLVFAYAEDYDLLSKGDVPQRDLRRALKSGGKDITVDCNGPIAAKHGLTEKQVDTILARRNCRGNREAAATFLHRTGAHDLKRPARAIAEFAPGTCSVRKFS